MIAVIILDRIILIPYRNGRAGIVQAEHRARAVFKLDFELGFVLLNEKRPGDARTQFARAISIDQALASRIPKAMGGTAS